MVAETLFEIAGAASTTAGNSPNGMYRSGPPRLPNCQTPPCTTYYRADDPAYMVDSGQTMGEWTILAPVVAFRAPRVLDLDLPPRHGWEAVNLGVPPAPRICFPDCWTEWSSAVSWALSISLVASAVLYVVVGVLVGRSRRRSADETKPSLIEWHPHHATIGTAVGLVRDGAAFVLGKRSCCVADKAAQGDPKLSYDDLPPVLPTQRGRKKDKREKKDRKEKRKKDSSRKEKRQPKPRPGSTGGLLIAPDALGPGGAMQKVALVEQRVVGGDADRLHSSQQKIKVAVRTLTL